MARGGIDWLALGVVGGIAFLAWHVLTPKASTAAVSDGTAAHGSQAATHAAAAPSGAVASSAGGAMSGTPGGPISRMVAAVQAAVAQQTRSDREDELGIVRPAPTREQLSANAAKQAAPNEYPRPLAQGSNATRGVTDSWWLNATRTVQDAATFGMSNVNDAVLPAPIAEANRRTILGGLLPGWMGGW